MRPLLSFYTDISLVGSNISLSDLFPLVRILYFGVPVGLLSQQHDYDGNDGDNQSDNHHDTDGYSQSCDTDRDLLGFANCLKRP